VNPAGTAIAAALLAKANDNAVVKLTGNQTIAGQKTFLALLTGPTIKSGVGTAGSGTLIGDVVNNTANGANAVAEGSHATASGANSHAEGIYTTASAAYSHAEGAGTTASEATSHAEGDSTTASGPSSHAEGISTTASGAYSHAEGENTTASGDSSHAGGAESLASKIVSYARGRKAQAIHDGASVETDDQDAVLASTAANQRTWRFLNGYRFFGGALYIDALTASRPLWLDASKNVTSPTAADFRTSIEGQRTPVVNSSSITAVLDTVYHGTAAATYTDPTPAEGRGYLVRVVNGTQTVGATAYAAEGTVIFREYHSGAWRNRVLFGGADAAGVRANIGVQAAPVTTTTSQSTSYSWQPAQNGDVLKLTLTGAVALTLSDPATTTVPLHVTVEAIQDGTGGRVLTLAGNVSTPGAVQPTLSATINAIDALQFVWTGAKWRWVNSSYAQGNL
jgi:hypothetical protein